MHHWEAPPGFYALGTARAAAPPRKRAAQVSENGLAPLPPPALPTNGTFRTNREVWGGGGGGKAAGLVSRYSPGGLRNAFGAPPPGPRKPYPAQQAGGIAGERGCAGGNPPPPTLPVLDKEPVLGTREGITRC